MSLKAQKQGIAPVIKELKLHETAQFPFKSYSVVNAAIQRIKTEQFGKNFKQNKNKDLKAVVVTRTA